MLLFRGMNPDKLFDYLDGKLPDHERRALEERLMGDASARREFDVARRIHASMREDEQAREHLRQSLEKAAAATLTPPPLGVSELRITTERGQSDAVADGILTAAKKFLGAATKGVPNNGELQVLVEIPANKAAEFKSALSPLPGVKEVNGEVSAGNSAEKISVIIALTEAR